MLLIVVCVVATVAAAAAYVKVAPRKYTAQAQLLISPVPQSGSVIGLPILYSSGDPTRDILTASSLITTPQVAQATIAALHLRESASDVLGQVQATPVGGSNLIAVQATAASGSAAQALANEFVRQVIATRAAALHAAVAQAIPGVRAQVASVPPADRNGPGSLGAQLGQLEQFQHAGDPTMSIASFAVLPSLPSSPQTKLALLAALLGGLVIGIGAAFAFDALDPRLRREEQLRELFGVPILTRIPEERKRRRSDPLAPEELSVASEEGFRTLRTVLTSRGGDDPSVFLVTSSAQGEGKTTAAINLAASLAHGGARVILIEADLRRPKIAHALGLERKYGTEHVLLGEVALEEALTPATFGGVQVQILAVDKPGADLADRLSPSVARWLVRQAAALADYVVIDSPPPIAVSDALPLARLADEILVVARLSRSKLATLSELHDLLYDQGCYPSGIILVGGRPSRAGRRRSTRGPLRGSPPAGGSPHSERAELARTLSG